jgi:regulator of sigma E protease
VRLLLILLAAGLAVLLREVGRGLLAWALGLRVQRVGVGFGPPMFTLEMAGRTWVLGAFPFGGSVEVAGMDPLAEEEQAGDLRRVAPWRRWVLLASGPVLSLLTAWALLVTLYATGTHAPVGLTVGTVQPGSEAARAGIRPGDAVVSVEGQPLTHWGALVDRVRTAAAQPLHLILHRDGELLSLVVTPRPDDSGGGRLGISQRYEHRDFPLPEAAALAWAHLGRTASDGIHALFPVARPALPSRLVHKAAEAFTTGGDAFLRLLAGICTALGLLHLVPVPPLDAGRALLVLARPRLKPTAEAWLTALGTVSLLAVLVASALD